MRKHLWVTGADAFRRARAAAQTRADLASRPVLVWRARRSPPSYLVDIVPDAWSDVDLACVHHPVRIRATYRQQVKLLLDEIRRAVTSGTRCARSVGPEPLAALQRLEQELAVLHSRLSSPDAPDDLLIPASDPDVFVDETGQYRHEVPVTEGQ